MPVIDDLPREARHIIRDIDAVTNSAIAPLYLAMFPMFNATAPIKVSILSIPHSLPSDGSRLDDLPALLQFWEQQHRLNQTQRKVIEDAIGRGPLDLQGYCHCEAGIMAILFKKTVLEDSIDDDAEKVSRCLRSLW